MRLEAFVQVIADRLSDIVPEGTQVITYGTTLEVQPPSVIGTRIDIHLSGSDPKQAVLTIMSRVQDAIAESLGVPWPNYSKDGSEPHYPEMPLPGVAIEGSIMRIFFGPEEKPVVEMLPIRLDSIA